MEFANSINNNELKFEVSRCLGSLYWQLGLYSKATENFRLANGVAEANNWKEKVVSAQIGIAMILWSDRNYKQAGQAARAVYKLTRDINVPSLEGKALIVLGIISFTQKKYPTAIRNFSQAVKYFRHGKPTIYVQLLLNRGMALQMNKQYSAGLKQYRLAELVLVSHEHSDQDKVQIELLRSSAFYQKGDLPNAEAALKRVSAIGVQVSKDTTRRTFFESSLGRVYLDLGEREKGGRFLRSAAQLWKKRKNPEIRPDLSLLFMIEPENM